MDIKFENPFANKDLYKTIYKPIADLQETMVNYVASLANNWQNVFTSFAEELSSLSKIDPRQFLLKYMTVMIEIEWFPYYSDEMDLNFFADIEEIYNRSRTIKSKRRNIEKYLFMYFTAEKLNEVKGLWEKSDLPKEIKNILRQALNAHLKRQYAVSVPALLCLWDYLIFSIDKNYCYHSDKEKHKLLNSLIQSDSFNSEEMSDVIYGYFKEYVYYICKNQDSIKTNSPGRNGIAHGWDLNYASRTVSLKAILITDFLIQRYLDYNNTNEEKIEEVIMEESHNDQ